MHKEPNYLSECQKWEDFLWASPLHFLRIKRGLKNENGTYLRGEYPNTTTYIFAADVFRSHDSFQSYLNEKIGSQKLTAITILPRKKNGTGTLLVEGFSDKDYVTYKILKMLTDASNSDTQVTTKKTVSMTPEIKSEPIPQPVIPSPMHHSVSYPVQNHNGLAAAAMQGMGGPAATAQAAGLGMSQFVELQKNADRYQEVKDKYNKLKEEHHALILRNRTLETDLSSAEKAKELAVLAEQLKKSNFFDSQAAEKMTDALPALFEMITNKAGGHASTGLNAPSGLSAAKSDFVGYLADQKVTDEMMMPLTSVMYLLAHVPNYPTALETLNQQYGNQDN